MKKTLMLISIFFMAGCASISIPDYIQDEHPYPKEFYAGFDKVRDATIQAMEELGWEVSKQTDPIVFERSKSADGSENRQVLLFTSVRQTALFLGTRYARMNVYLRSVSANTTAAELRYITVTSVPFKSFNDYRNDGFAQKLFTHIEGLLD